MPNKSRAQRKYEKESALNVPTRAQLIERVKAHIRINESRSKGVEVSDNWVRQDTALCKRMLHDLEASRP